ncbi:MAG: SDR family NAD(P)-dependent oxidoreductase [Bdellovibrionales bacterium]|nr:SDR family NAD(P)-dependent oxidoreductase [Bdellovibrionales bacterium]
MSQTNSKASSSRRVLITGATGALGASVVARFAAAGDAVFAVHTPTQKPASLEGVEWIGADLTVRKSVIDLFAKLDDLDAVVHCAGGFRYGMVDAISGDDFRFLTALNFESAFYVAAAAVPGMKKRKRGSLVFISSMATQNPGAGLSAYAATKAAVNGLVTSLAAELKAEGIRVNAVMPSTIDTPANRKDMPHADTSKWVSPDDLAEILYDLTLPKTKSITGALIAVPGRV